ncbi:MAG: DGQHR domain-containing protein [Planctomycetes bacterium]|nr:DGQHR domain-containing protein [Planctomycetota bacterium]
MNKTKDDDIYLGPLLTDPSRIRRVAVRRRKPFDEKSVIAEAIPDHEAKGWLVDKKLKRVTKVKREKEIDERLENRFWMLLFKMGYPEMSDGRDFSFLIERKGAAPLRKQIDVFAKDDETVIVAECKASEKLTRRSPQKDVEEFANLKGPIASAVSKHYGANIKLKLIWLFVTENIIWSTPDRQRALGENIRIITERELRYYAQIAEHLGKAARYQFLAEFLKDQKIPELSGKKVPAIQGKLGGKMFFCFVTTPRHLLKISFVNHRSLNDPEGAPTYQRLVSRSRMRDIGDFIKAGGYFPNNMIINFTRSVRFDKVAQDESSGVTFGHLYLPDRYRSAWVIDGQHRLYGFSPIDDKYLDQNIIVVAFEMLPKAEEANLFVTINHEQKSVPKHLLDDLEGELKWGSTIPSERIGAIGARLINCLNTDVGEPFYNRITQQGMPSTNKTCLTIPAIKDALRRSGLLGRAMMNNSTYDLGAFCGRNDSETLDRARSALNHYFGQLRNANLTEWESGRDGFLCTNVAVQAYIMLLGALVKYWEANTATDAREMGVEDMMLEIEEYLKPVTDFLESSNTAQIKSAFQVPFGSGGPPEYYYRLCKIIKDKYADFQPEGMERWEEEQSEERIQDADFKLKIIVSEIRKYIFDLFRVVHGEARGAYWDKGVIDKALKAEAYKRSLDYDVEERLPLETYLEVVEMKKIVENKQNWAYFKKVFNIPEPGEKGLAKNLKWMDRINELRRIPAHPAKERHYKVEDFQYIDFIHGELMARIKEAQENPILEATPDAEDNNG